MQLEKKLKENFQKQTAPFNEVFDIYNKVLLQCDEYKQKFYAADSELRELKNNFNDFEIFDQQKQKINQQEKYINKLEEETDVQTFQLDQRNKQYGKLEQDYHEEKNYSQEISQQNQHFEKIIKEYEDQTQRQKELIESQDQQMEVLRQDANNLIEDKKKLYNENMMYTNQLLKVADEKIERMNQMSEMENELAIKKKQLESKEKHLAERQNHFDQTQKSHKNKNQSNTKSISPPSKESNTSTYINLEENYIDPQSNECLKERKSNELKQITILNKVHSNEILNMVSNPQGSLLASCGGDQCIRFTDLQSRQTKGQIISRQQDRVFLSIDFHGYNNQLITGTNDRQVIIYQLDCNKVAKQLTGHLGQVNSVRFTGTTKCVSASNDKQLKQWDLSSGDCLSSLPLGSNVKTLSVYSGNQMVVSGHNDGCIRLVSLRENKSVFKSPPLFDSPLSSVSVSQDDNTLAVISMQGTHVSLFDLRMQKTRGVLVHDDYYNSHEYAQVLFTPNDRLLAGNNDGNIYQWDVNSMNYKGIIKGKAMESVVLAMHYTPILGQLLSADTRGNIAIYS